MKLLTFKQSYEIYSASWIITNTTTSGLHKKVKWKQKSIKFNKFPWNRLLVWQKFRQSNVFSKQLIWRNKFSCSYRLLDFHGHSLNKNLWIRYVLTLGVSVKNMDELASLADILVWAPCKAGKNVECSKAGFLNFKVGATSRVIRK